VLSSAVPGTTGIRVALQQVVTLSAYAGLGLTPAEIAARYRAYAADCVTVARNTGDTAGKLRLLDMGRAWLDLADQAEKNGETVLFYETPERPGRHS
jgi:hypothetical protein